MKFAERYAGKGKRLLVVEDDENVMEVTLRALKTCGYDVVGVTNARDTIRVFEEEKGKFDLLFSDVELPDQSGIILAQLLSKINPGIKIILTSGYSSAKFGWANFEKKGYRFLEKPYPLVRMLREIHDMANKAA